ncbi:MAG: GNAT family N-acetyltransferase [Rubrobacteraceae bacterium]
MSSARNLREVDHAEIITFVDEWWGGRHVSDKLPRLFFKYFRDTSFVLEEDGRILAFLIGIIPKDSEEAYIHFVGIHPDHRKTGLAKRLYETFLDEARDRECKRVRCITSPVNKTSVSFHTGMGFEIEGGDGEVDGVSIHTNYDGDGKDKVLFVKKLSG